MDYNVSEVVRELLKIAGPVELLRIAPIAECRRLSGLSAETLRRHHKDQILEIAPGRVGMRVIDALLVNRDRTRALPPAA